LTAPPLKYGLCHATTTTILAHNGLNITNITFRRTWPTYQHKKEFIITLLHIH